jgi:CheY-like chemotaxis protein
MTPRPQGKREEGEGYAIKCPGKTATALLSLYLALYLLDIPCSIEVPRLSRYRVFVRINIRKRNETRMALVDVLHIEDDDIDAEAVVRALAAYQDVLRMIRAVDGAQALRILRGLDQLRLQLPYVIILDLQLPDLNGFELLKVLRSDAQLSQSPVFVLTGSDDPAHKQQALRQQVVAYIHKNVFHTQSKRFIRLLVRYVRGRLMRPRGDMLSS